MTRAKGLFVLVGFILACILPSGAAGAQVAEQTADARLLRAADRGDFKGVKAALAAGAEVNAVNSDDESALVLAGMRGRLYEIVPSYRVAVIRADIINFLLDQGANLPAVKKGPFETNQDYIPLRMVNDLLYFRQYDVARLLLQHGGPPEALNLFSVMRSYPSSRRPDRERRNLFEQALTKSDAKTRTEALQTAIASDDPEYFVRRLWETGADLNAHSWNGLTPLTLAIVQKKKAIVRLLLDHGADPNKPVAVIKTAYLTIESKYYGLTPLEIARDARDDTIISLLKKAGATE